MRAMGLMAMAAMVFSLTLAGCETAPPTVQDRDDLEAQVELTLDRFIDRDPGLERSIDDAYAYAVYPSIGKAGAGVGGAYGRGMVFRDDEFIGWTDVTQGTIGLQLGGQTYSQLVLLQDSAALGSLQRGGLRLAAGTSAVAARQGAAQQANYEDGVLVFTMTTGGLMFEAAIGGQTFGFTPVADADEEEIIEPIEEEEPLIEDEQVDEPEPLIEDDVNEVEDEPVQWDDEL